MNFKILLFYIVIGGLIQATKLLTDSWTWLGSKTAKCRYYKKVINILTFVCLLTGGIHQVMTEIEKNKLLFFINVESIDVTPGYSKSSKISMVNNLDYPVYQTDLKIAIESGDLSVDDIKLKPKDEAKLNFDLGGVIVSFDVYSIVTITKEGKREQHNMVYDIDAHSTKEFIVEINANKAHEKSKVVFKIGRSSKKPADILHFDPFISCQNDKLDFYTYHETSRMMLNQKRYKEALICCEKALIKDPNSGKAHNAKGVALLFLNERDCAIREFEAAIASDPKLAPPYTNLAGVLKQQGKFQEAIRLLEIISGFNNEKHPEIFVLWGQCLSLQNDSKGAIEKYQKAIELDPECGLAYFLWGLTLKNAGDCEKAIIKFQKATEYEHAFKLDSYGMWGACLEELGDNPAAINKFLEVIKIAPKSNEAKKSKKSIEEVEKKMSNFNTN